jgi:two-component system LytT family response regulator
MANGKWRVLVADDEPAARRGVRQLLAAFPDFAVVGECRDGREVLASLDRLQPDVLFLDIQMPELDGFDVIRKRTPDHMRRRTPDRPAALRSACLEAEAHDTRWPDRGAVCATMQRSREGLGSAGSIEPEIVVTTTRATKIRRSKRSTDRGSDNYARAWLGERMLREPLARLETRVGRHGFARAHRQALVRVAAVRELQKTGDGTIVAVLAGGASIPISRRRRAAFAKAIKARQRQ